MDDLWQRALSDEVRAQLGRIGRTQKDAYGFLGISSTAWQTYFKSRTRDIPSSVLLSLAQFLGIPLSELLARTEAREAELVAGREPDELEDDIGREARRAVSEGRAAFGGDVVDPSGRHNPDVDDGATGRSDTA